MSQRSAQIHATIDDVAKHARVSTATVSRAMRDHPHVAPATRQRVLASVAELGYVANPNASRLASGRSRMIGLLTPQLTSWYTSEILAGVEEVLAGAGYDLVIGTANPIARERVFRGDATFRQRVDGILLVDVFCSEGGARQLAELRTPTVVLGERVDALSALSVDNRCGAALAAAHLLELGHRHVGMVSGGTLATTERNVPADRRIGFIGAIEAAGIDWDESWEADGDFTIAGARRAATELLARSPRPTALFCMSDEMAFGAFQAAEEAGLDVPGELSIVGFDDHPVAEARGLTTIRQPVREMGRAAAEQVVGLVEGIAEPSHRQFALELVRRGSTAPVVVAGHA
jgi:DNA-binding LacI/PurR family transcriptional regulator